MNFKWSILKNAIQAIFCQLWSNLSHLGRMEVGQFDQSTFLVIKRTLFNKSKPKSHFYKNVNNQTKTKTLWLMAHIVLNTLSNKTKSAYLFFFMLVFILIFCQTKSLFWIRFVNFGCQIFIG